MSSLHFPFLECLVLVPLAGAFVVARARDLNQGRRWCGLFSAATFVFAVAAWIDLAFLGASEASDPWSFFSWIAGQKLLSVDELSAPLLPTTALVYFLTILTTPRTKAPRFSFAMTLVSEAICLATFVCRPAWGIIALLAAGTIPPFLELRSRQRSARVYVSHMLLFVGLLAIGWRFAELEGDGPVHSWWAIVPLLAAVLIRSGMIPVHCWVADLFEKGTFGTALLFVLPLPGAYAAVRLVMPVAPDWVLRSIGVVSLTTVVYSAGMALVQREARRFFCYLFLSHAGLVLVGLEVVNSIGLTGALCVWLSVGLSLGGFSLTLRGLEARFGRLSLSHFRGLYEQTPALAVCFALTGLASVGFPGTLGFVGIEMLVDGAVEAYPHIGIALVAASAINGIAIVRAYFWLFTGTRHMSTIPLGIGRREWLAVLTLAGLILGGGLFPQPGVASRYHAAQLILRDRAARHLDDSSGVSATDVSSTGAAPSDAGETPHQRGEQ